MFGLSMTRLAADVETAVRNKQATILSVGLIVGDVTKMLTARVEKSFISWLM
jgi:hypothetical protein